MHAMITSHVPFTLAALVSMFVLPGFPAQAQTWNNSQKTQQEHVQERDPNRDHFVLGAGVGYTPAYQGADKYVVQPIPVIDVAWGPFYANLRNGIGVHVIDTGGLTLGAGIAVLPGYSTKDAPAGIGKLSLGVGGRVYASVRTHGLVATIGATQGLSGGTEGFIADASLSYPMAVAARVTLIPTLGLTWADRKHNDRYFGVTEQQSFASGLPQFHTGSGFKDASALLTLSYRLTRRINLGVSGGVTTLLGDMKDSPLVIHKTQPSGFLTFSYRFGS